MEDNGCNQVSSVREPVKKEICTQLTGREEKIGGFREMASSHL
jgi:hypothetical protein